jgi:hypothetical protein
MKKNAWLSGLPVAALLTAGLILTGCSNPTGGGKSSPPSAPVAPGTLAVTAGDAQLTISWAAVADATSYEVYYGTGTDFASAARFDGDADKADTEAVITGLANGTSYYVWVKARNTSGLSGFSPVGNGIPNPPAPAVPETPAVTVGDTWLTVSWAAVTGADSYEVYYGTGTDPDTADMFGGDADLTDTEAVITALTNGTTYYVWVKAKNASGSSSFSPAVSGIPNPPPAAEPTAPGTPVVTPGNAQLTVSWPTVAGADSYELYYSPGINPAVALRFDGDTDTTDTEAVITGLANGIPYYVWVKAKNAAGLSSFSPMGSGMPNPSPPAVPGTPAIMGGDTWLTVNWAAVTGADSYELYYGTGTDPAIADRFDGDADDTDTEAVITALINGTTYYVWVKAKNNFGSSGFSPMGSGTPNPPPLPAAPGTLAVTPDDARLTISWAAVSGATSYEVYYAAGTNPAAAGRFAGDADESDTTVVITGLANGTGYNLWVKAKNASGTSGFSPMGNGIPSPTTVDIAITGWTGHNAEILYASGESPVTLSKTGAGSRPTLLTVTVNPVYTVAEWQFNGEPRPETGAAFTVNAARLEYTSGVIHRLGVIALKDGIQYSTDIRFAVVD